MCIIGHRRISGWRRVSASAKAVSSVLCVLVILGTLSSEANAGPNEDILSAARVGDRAAMEAALAAGASVNAVDKKGLSPLRLVGLTPLGLAAAYGHRNIAEFLLEHGANVDAVSADGFEQTPLNEAAHYGSTDVAALLLDHGADINARDIMGATPLEWGALYGGKNVVSLLIARGAVVNAQAASGKTALHLAATAGHTEVVALLLAHGADAKIRNSDGQTPRQEMQASALDPATKAKIAAMLGAKHAPAHVQRPVAATTPSPPPSQAVAPNALPACTDVAGIARLVMQANPGERPEVLAMAVDQFQIAMGCRPPPQKTECSWIGDTWTCTTK